MKIGVSGASGHLGRAVVSELLRRPGGHEVVAITRTPENVSGPAQGRFGGYNRHESLAEAYAGLDRLLIISTVDLEPGKRGQAYRLHVGRGRAAGGGAGARRLLLAGRAASYRHGAGLDPLKPNRSKIESQICCMQASANT